MSFVCEHARAKVVMGYNNYTVKSLRTRKFDFYVAYLAYMFDNM